MKLSSTLTLLVIAIAASAMQSASAQETRGARFNYAPNIWHAERAQVPKGYGEHADTPHSVQSGSVPTNTLLGIDPSLLEKPAAPPPQVAARPATTSVTPRMFLPKTNATFNPAFGKPQGVVAQSLPANLPVLAPVARPQTTPIHPATAPAQVARAHRSGVQTGVHAHLMTPRIAHVTPVAATPAVASYGKGFGYDPGAYLPQNGAKADGLVSGKLLTKTRH